MSILPYLLIKGPTMPIQPNLLTKGPTRPYSALSLDFKRYEVGGSSAHTRLSCLGNKILTDPSSIKEVNL